MSSMIPEDKVLYNGEIIKVDVSLIEKSPNYRDPRSQRKLLQLGRSMKNHGQLNPLLLEETRDEQKRIIGYERIAGERRYLAGILVGLPELKAKVYKDLTELERLALQINENIKKPINRHEKAEQNVYDLVTILGSSLSEPEQRRVLKESDYYSIPEEVRRQYPLTQYAHDRDTSPRAIRRDIHYTNLHGDLKRMVEESKISFSIGSELGRIPNRNIQRQMYAKYKYQTIGNRARKRNAREFAKIVSQELQREERKKNKEEKLELRVQNNNYNNKTVEKTVSKELDKHKKVRGVYNLLLVEPTISDIITNYDNGLRPFNELSVRVDKTLKELEERIEESTGLLSELRESDGKKKTVRDKVLEGEIAVVDEDYKKLFELEGSTEMIDRDKLVHDSNNPRKTFDEEYIRELAESFDKVGQLHPIITRPYEQDNLMIVVGHNRDKAAGLLDWKQIEGYVRDMTDFEARLVQLIEDYFEQPRKWELAQGVADLYNMRKEEAKEEGLNLTKKGFMEEIRWINMAFLNKSINYAELDQTTKNLYKQQIISWSQLQELSRVPKDDRYNITLSIIANNSSPSKTKKIVDSHLEEMRNREVYGSEMGMFNEQVDAANTNSTKKQLAKEFLLDLSELHDNLQPVLSQELNIFSRERIVEKFYHLETAWKDLEKKIRKNLDGRV